MKAFLKSLEYFSRIVGAINSRILLSVLFLTVLTPVGLLMRLFANPLNSEGKDSYWVSRSQPSDLERQF